MTSLAIIGSGIAGRSLIYTLAKEEKHFEKITLFSSDNITLPCTLSSTATVALRGITKGHSELGDLLVTGFETVREHIRLDNPTGIQKILQYSAATTKLDQFLKRFPEAKKGKTFLKDEAFMFQEEAFMIDPATYSDWLLNEAKMMKKARLEILDDLVVEVSERERVHLKTLNGRNLSFDKVVFACGSYNRFWKGLAPETKINTSKPAQGSFFEFQNVEWKEESFSLTLDGDNIVWNGPLKRLYVGSTTSESSHYLAPMNELNDIYERLSEKVTLTLPPKNAAIVKTGLREKASKRMPYLVNKNHLWFIGGLYKNAFTVSLELTRSLSRQLL